MKKMKAAAFAACAFSAVMLLSGFDSAMTATDLYQKVKENASSVSAGTISGSFSADAVLQVGTDASTATTMPMQGSVDFSASFTTEPYMMQLEAEASGSAMGQSGSGTMKEYIVTESDGTGTTYSYIDTGASLQSGETEGTNTGWTAQKMDADQMKKMEDSVRAVQSGDYSALKELGIDYEALEQKFLGASTLAPSAVTVSGKECYELETKVTGDVISELFNAVLNSQAAEGSGQLDDQTMQIIQMMTSSLQADVKTDYTTDTFQPVHGEFDMSGSDFSWIGDLVAQSASAAGSTSQAPQVSVQINTLGGTVDYDFTSPVNIEVPEEAKNAPVQDASQLQNQIGSALAGAEAEPGTGAAADSAAGTDAAGSGSSDTSDVYESEDNTPVRNADGTYTISEEDMDGNLATVTIALPDGWTADYQDEDYLGASDAEYHGVSYTISTYFTVDEAVEEEKEVADYLQSADGYTDISVSGPEEIKLSDGSAAKVLTSLYTYEDMKMGNVVAILGTGNKTVSITRNLFAGEDGSLEVPSADDMKAFCDGVKFQ